MKSPVLSALLCAATLLLFSGMARADAGHDHGDAPAATAGAALPRFAIASGHFELVGVLDGQRLALYLDRFADNSPVPEATLTLEIGDKPVTVVPHGVGEFEATLAAPLAPGAQPVRATVQAGAQRDQLAGELDVHEEAHAHAAAPTGAGRIAAWALGALALLALSAWGARRAFAARAPRTGALA